MNTMPLPAAAFAAASVAAPTPSPKDSGLALLAAARLLLADLEHGRAIDARALRTAMIAAFGGSDAEGVWDWKIAYEACEAAQILFLRKFGPAMRGRAASPSAFLAMLAKLAALLPTQTRRSEESQALQQFSTPIATRLRRRRRGRDHADRPRAGALGRHRLACHLRRTRRRQPGPERARRHARRAARPAVSRHTVTRHDAAHIHDHLDAAVRPTVVLMNPPFSVAAHVEGRVADAALRHISSALARLAEGGRLVAITGASLSPDNPAWRDSFIRLQQRGRILFSAAIDGGVYARHGTTSRPA